MPTRDAATPPPLRGLGRAWVALRLPLPALLLALTPLLAPELPGRLLTASGYGHGLVKQHLGMVQTLLVREPELPGLAAALLLLTAATTLLPERLARVAAALGLLAAPLLLPHGSAIFAALGALLVIAALRPDWVSAVLDPRAPWLVLIPGVELLLPGWALRRLGSTALLARALAALLLSGLWFLGDTRLSQDRYAQAVSHFPTSLTDARAEVWGRAPEGQWCEFHDVDLVGDRLVVVAEVSRQLRSYPLDGGGGERFTPFEVPGNWEPWGGLVLDSESDPATGRTFFLDGPHHLTTLRWTGHAWQRVGRSDRIPTPLHHVYSRWFPEREELVMIGINTQRTPDPSRVVIVNTQTGRVQERVLRTPEGEAVPNIRELTWIPSIQRYALSPDFGDHLYLADPWTATATPWVPLPTLNGKLLYSAERDELLIASPDQAAVLVFDPHTGALKRRLWNLPGVRAMAVDAERGWLLSGSVLTGAVLIQDIETGELLDVLRTFQPMMREILLIPERGEAYLTTWGSFYRIRYTEPRP